MLAPTKSAWLVTLIGRPCSTETYDVLRGHGTRSSASGQYTRTPGTPAAPMRRAMAWTTFCLGSTTEDQVVFQDEGVEGGGLEGAHSVGGRAHDRLLHVEGGVQQHGHAGELSELVDQLPVPRVRRPADGLRPGRAVDVHDGGYAPSLVAGDVEHG